MKRIITYGTFDLLHYGHINILQRARSLGDYLIVAEQETARNGDIVVALVGNDDATVKRFFREADHIRLQPENDDYEPIISRDVKIRGKVIGLYRHY